MIITVLLPEVHGVRGLEELHVFRERQLGQPTSTASTSSVGSAWDRMSSGAFLMSSTSLEFVGRTIHFESVATLNNPGPA